MAVRCGCKIMTLMLLAVALFGCGQKPIGPERGIVHGKVSLDGKPIAVGTITFAPTGAKAGPAWIGAIKDGQYVSGTSGPVVGKSRVEIRASRTVAAKSANDEGDWKSNYVEAVPVRYNNQSVLEADVRSGDNTFDFELESK